MIEGPDEAAIRALAEEVADAIKSACGVRA
jgi:hypothetical protein